MHNFSFQDHNYNITTTHLRSSPDSVFFSNLSLFSSSTSASIDRCSSASDAIDRDSIVSAMSLNLSGRAFRDFSTSTGPDLDPNNNSTVLSKKVEKAKYIIGYTDAHIDSARSSFSQAVKDCQNRKPRSEILRRKSVGNQLMNMTSSVSNSRTSIYASPVTPKYSPANSGIQRGWNSERVPLNKGANRRVVNSGLSFYNSGKALPSKWEDAERWICSPVAGDGALRPSVKQAQRRPKAKSGPVWPRRSAYNSVCSNSPAVHMFDGGSVNLASLFPGSPFSSRVNAGDCLSNSGNLPSVNEPCLARSLSVHGCSESLSESLLRVTQDGRIGCVTDAATNISCDVSRRDMATQMSPDGSPYSSPRRRNVSNSMMSTSIHPVEETRSSKADVRDVQVDDQFGLSRWSMKTRAQIPARRSASEMMDDWKRKALEARSANWDVSEMTKTLSKVKREEAKITAWENLQKAKAEAAIRKLEMKLEKKRSSSMDKIMNKLRSNQKKAQEMRGSVLSKQTHDQVSPRSSLSSSSSNKVISIIRTPHIGSISGCFTCHAF